LEWRINRRLFATVCETASIRVVDGHVFGFKAKKVNDFFGSPRAYSE
jgi:hypothetical protein